MSGAGSGGGMAIGGAGSGRVPASRSLRGVPVLVAVTPNPSVDKVWHIPGFRSGGAYRVARVWTGAGGKGCNVARVAKQLAAHPGGAGTGPGAATGALIVATGFLAGAAGGFVEEDLRRHGIDARFVRAGSGETRTCPTIVDEETGEVTEIREPGPALTPADGAAFVRHLETLLAELIGAGARPALSLSGSLPPGLPPEFCRDVILTAAKAHVPSVLDSSGEALRSGAGAAPWAVKVNESELAELDGRVLTGDTGKPGPYGATDGAEPRACGATGDAVTRSETRLLQTLDDLVRAGVTLAVVTRGRSGLLASDGRTVWRGLPPAGLHIIQPVGSGDAATAALALGVARLLARGDLHPEAWPMLGLPHLPEEARAGLVRDMIAAGAANAATEGIGTCPRDVFEAMAARAVVTALAAPTRRVGKEEHRRDEP